MIKKYMHTFNLDEEDLKVTVCCNVDSLCVDILRTFLGYLAAATFSEDTINDALYEVCLEKGLLTNKGEGNEKD